MRAISETLSGSGLRRAVEAETAVEVEEPCLLQPGSLCLEHYRIGRRLGRGGYAEVYQATCQEDGTEVAVKVLLPRSGPGHSRSRDRMLVEGHLALGLRHPQLVRYLKVGEDRGNLCLVMELVDGGDAEALPDRHHGLVPAAIIATLGRDAARGLQALHDLGLIHRDIKPANLLLDASGACKVGDFGLVRPIEDDNSMTLEGNVVGTPAFFAPEQARKTAGTDHRADIYGLGASLHFLATGRAPHHAPSLWMMLTSLVTEPFPDPRRLRPDLPEDLAHIIMSAGAKDPARRYQSAGALAEALEAFLVGAPQPQESLHHPAVTITSSGSGPAILLVDDDPLVRRLYAGRLKLDGFHVETAATADEAIAAAARTRPAAVVLDLYLGSEDGTTVLGRLRSLPGLGGVPVVVFSNALADDTRLQQVQDLGVTRILAKAATPPRSLSALLLDLLGLTARPQQFPSDAHPVAEVHGVARTALAHLQALLPDLRQAGAGQSRILRGIAETARGLSAAAAASDLPAMAAVAEGTDHLARRLAAEGEAITPSVQRTLMQAVNCLHFLAAQPAGFGATAWSPAQALVVDDDRLAARYASKALSKARIPTMTAHSPEEALRLCNEHAFGLVVSDVGMPGMSGDAFALAVRRFHRRESVIFVTTCRDFTGHLADGRTCEVIAKPYMMAELAVKALVHLAQTDPPPGDVPLSRWS
jgi:serine/threonine protein kinase/CheY-like chemotaxis protein